MEIINSQRKEDQEELSGIENAITSVYFRCRLSKVFPSLIEEENEERKEVKQTLDQAPHRE